MGKASRMRNQRRTGISLAPPVSMGSTGSTGLTTNAKLADRLATIVIDGVCRATFKQALADDSTEMLHTAEELSDSIEGSLLDLELNYQDDNTGLAKTLNVYQAAVAHNAMGCLESLVGKGLSEGHMPALSFASEMMFDLEYAASEAEAQLPRAAIRVVFGTFMGRGPKGSVGVRTLLEDVTRSVGLPMTASHKVMAELSAEMFAAEQKLELEAEVGHPKGSEHRRTASI